MASVLPAGLSPRYWQTWRPVGSGNSGISESLKAGEEWIGTWDGLGLYEGNNKIPSYQSLNFHLTTHRILLEPQADPSAPSSSAGAPRPGVPGLSASLSDIRQTEFYTGFMRSSAKITLSLAHPPAIALSKDGSTANSTSGQAQQAQQDEGWTCTVCAYRNAPSETKCGLCGVGKDRIPSRTSTPGPASIAVKRRSIPGAAGSPGLSNSPSDRQPIMPLADASDSTGPQSGSTGGKIACPACTFLNHGSMTRCEICSTALPRKSAANGTAPARSTVAGAGEEARMDIVRLSFRKGGEKVAYAKLKSVLSQKAWEKMELPSRQSTGDAGAGDGAATPRAVTGIDGILQTMSLDNRNRSEHLSSAFADLEVLMVRAGEMVKMAQSLNDKLLAQQRTNPPVGGAEKARQEAEATLIRTSLVQLGLPAPALTSDMVRSDKEYLEGLARELGALLTGQGGKGKGREVDGLMTGRQGRGVIGLDEVWGLWMRARGVALLSPSTLVSILPFLPDQTSPPIRLRTLPSGLKVLFSPTYASVNILSRLLELFSPASQSSVGAVPESDQESPLAEAEIGLSLIEIAAHEGLAIGLAKELMDEIERLPSSYEARDIGGLVRDEQAEQGAGGVRWYRDIISGWSLAP